MADSKPLREDQIEDLTASKITDFDAEVSGNSAVQDNTAKISYIDAAKVAGIENNADVTDTANVTAAGALMDSEVTNLADVKAFDTSDYATAAQGTLADSATQPGDLGAVATSNDYADLDNKPTIPTVDDTAYDATSWNGNTDAATKNAIRDKIETLGGGGGSGDVVGPASATDNAVARYDSTTGKLIQNSGVTIDDSDNVSGVATLNANTVSAISGSFASGSMGGVTISGGEVDGVDIAAEETRLANTSGTNTGDQTSVSGNAGTATTLQTGRTIRTNLASTTAVSFNGSANITPGVTGTLPLTRGGTGGTSASAAKTNLALNNVDNTSDANKPVSTAQATADGLRLLKTENLADLNNLATARANLKMDRVSFEARMNAAQGTTANVFTKVAFNNSVYDNGSNYNTASFTFTAPYNGIYQFNAYIDQPDGGTPSVLVSLYVNGVREQILFYGDMSVYRTAGGSTQLKLDATDEVEVYFRTSLADEIDIEDSVFSGHLVHRLD